ncbi:MAG TPA: type IV pilus biogenesis/stability protein PilW [Steroidobacteraceae bacterium]|nr:type IV pilus biogenesis/stability protein PilW [Steroidobacteraceae bacterium]
MRRLRGAWHCVLLAAIALTAGCASTGQKADPKQAAAYNTQLGIEYLRQGNLAQAKDKLDRALEQDPQSGIAHAASGLLYDRLGEPATADRHFKRAVALEPDNPDIRNNYAVFLCSHGEPERGQQYFIDAAKNRLYRTPEVALLNAGKCARDAGDLERAEEHLRSAIAVRPDFAEPLLQLADLQFVQGRLLPARGFVQRYFAAGGSGPQSLWLGYRIEDALGNPDLAADFAARLKNEYPTSRETRELLRLEQGA